MILTALSLFTALFSQGDTPSHSGLAEANRCAAVVVRDGRVVNAGFYRRMVGFAAEAGTRGGLGQRQYLVWRTEDGEQPGTLRHAVEEAQRAGGGWISFAPELGDKTIRVEKTLRLGSNLTIDGGCVAPRIVGVGRGSLFGLITVSNVVLTRLQMTQMPGVIDGDCVTVARGTDKVWIAHNLIRSCKDGMIDITRPQGGPVRVTISGNDFRDQDKAILVGAEPGSSFCNGPPVIRVTLFRNSFQRTGQRHPRVSGSAFVHAVQNRMRFSPQPRQDGTLGGSSGIGASDGGRVLAEDLLFEPQGSNKLRLTNAAPDAANIPDCRLTAIRVERGSGPERAQSFRPDLVGGVPYRLPAAPEPRQLARLLDTEVGPNVR